MEYTIEEVSEDDYDEEIMKVIKQGLGDTYSQDVKSLEEEDSVLLVSKVNNKIVGFGCGYNSESAEEYSNILEQDLNANSVLEKVSVLESYRSKGIGSKLLRERLKRLKQPTITESWIRSDSPDSTSLLESHGFERLKFVEDRWLEESKEEDDPNFCPDCGRICRCDCAVYVLYEF